MLLSARPTHLANESLVTNSLLGKLGRVKSDFLFAGIDNMSYLKIQHEVKLKHYDNLEMLGECDMTAIPPSNI